METLCCVLDQDTLSSAQYWFSPGRQEIIIVVWDVKNQHKQTKTITLSTGMESPILFDTVKVFFLFFFFWGGGGAH